MCTMKRWWGFTYLNPRAEVYNNAITRNGGGVCGNKNKIMISLSVEKLLDDNIEEALI